MPREAMRDLVIVLPGILGSVLEKNGREVWAPSASMLSFALSRDALNRELLVSGDDPELDDLGDGVRATRVISDIHMLPGFWKIDGYTSVLKLFSDNFDCQPGQLATPEDGCNLFAFPYDWRRDNRAAARQLKRFIDIQLPRWRAASGATDAKVVLAAHSMGGLVSRYYLEVLGGWEHCRALVTFGTPHRGSLEALNYIANGYKLARADLSDALRSFQSVYQLLPNYQAVEFGNQYFRVFELDGIPNLSRERAQQAFDFHTAIFDAAVERRNDPARRDAYLLLPVVGTRQPTNLSASLDNQRLTIGAIEPPLFATVPAGGDGTVPFFSATPPEMANDGREFFISERHASLQAQKNVLEQVFNVMVRLQGGALPSVLNPEASESLGTPAISAELEDLYLADQPLQVRAQLYDLVDEPEALEARIESVDRPGEVQVQRFEATDEGYLLLIEHQPAGLYRIRISTIDGGPHAPPDLNDIFEVA